MRVFDAPDLAEAAQLMQDVWPRPCWRYSKGLLASYLERSDRWRIELGCEVDGKLVGFLGAVPFSGSLAGAPVQGAFTSFYTVHPSASMHGASQRLLSAVAERVRANGCERYVTLIDADQESRPLIEALHRRVGLAIQPIARVGFWIGALAGLRDPSKEVDAIRSVPYERRWLPACVALVRSAPEQHALAQTPSEAELDRILTGDAHGTTRLWLENDRVRGLALLRPREVIDQVPRRNLHVDWLLCATDTEVEARARFFERTLHEVAKHGIHLIVVPVGGEREAEMLRRIGLLRGKRTMQIYIATLGAGKPLTKAVESAWIEVF